MKKQICIIGGGALGIGLAGIVSARYPVTLCTKPAQIDVLRRQQITLSGDLERSVVSDAVTICALSDLCAAPEGRIFFVAVKANALDGVLESLQPHIDEQSVVVLLQNGLDIFFQATQIIDHSVPIIRLLVNFGLLKIGSASVAISGLPDFTIACLPRDADIAAEIITFFEELEVFIFKEVDIASAEWRKAVINLIVNPICTIMGAANGVILEKVELQELAADVLSEIKAVATADGFDLSDIEIDSLLRSVSRYRNNINSTLVDRREGRVGEIDYLLGRFLRRAASYNVATPCMQTLHRLYLAMG